MITLDDLKKATIDDIKKKPELSRAFGTLFYGDQTNADNLMRFWNNGIRDFETDKNYIVSGILNARMFNDLSNYLNRYNEWKNSKNPEDQVIANTQKDIAIKELNNKKQLLTNAGIDPNSVPIYQFLVSSFGTPNNVNTKIGPTEFGAGDLIKTPGDSKIYYITAEGQKAEIDSPKKLESLYGTDAWKRIKEVNPAQLSTIPTNEAFYTQTNINNKNPFFAGKTGLVQFTDLTLPGQPPIYTIFLADTSSKTLRPFASPEAFNNHYQGTLTLSDALDNGQVFQTSTNALANVLNPLSSFKMLTSNESIRPDGNYAGAELQVDSSKIINNYGKSKVSDSVINTTQKMLDTWLGWAAETPSAGVSTDLINSVKNDPNLISFYLNALLYGNYQLPDILRDLKRRQLIKNGRTDFNGTVVIDPNQTSDAYYATTQGQSVKNNNDLLLPLSITDKDMNMFNLSVFKLPEEAYKTLVPPFDIFSEEGKAEMEKIKSAYHDVLVQQLEAKTEREKAIADNSYQELRKTLDTNYGITLSNSVFQAWDQLNNLTKTYGEAGLLESGIEAENINNYLRRIRKADDIVREQHLTTEEKNKADYYKNYATSEQINKLTDVEKEKYGLKPSEEQLKFFSIENLKSLYPDLDEDQIKKHQTSIIDEFGNYRSVQYQKSHEDIVKTEEAKKTYQQSQVEYQKSIEEERAAEDFKKVADEKEKELVIPSTGTEVPGTPISPAPVITKEPEIPEDLGKYVRKKGTIDVYDISTDSPRLISFDEAMTKNIWNRVEEVDIIPEIGKVKVQKSTGTPFIGPPAPLTTRPKAGKIEPVTIIPPKGLFEEKPKPLIPISEKLELTPEGTLGILPPTGLFTNQPQRKEEIKPAGYMSSLPEKKKKSLWETIKKK